MKFKYDRSTGDFVRTTLVDTARTVIEDKGRVRGWVDRRLGDSFPEEVVEKVMRLGLECVEEGPEKRPDMSRVAGKFSKLFVQSENWFKKFKLPTEISVSLVPR
ncbi:hypothetical protein MLD38_003505 [Melastoma candidum]|uniref:Uncharacterized protein n=1 Tax=Melastoma candidum TaxID=119954 RepID=A0ACB9S2G1_9MYRT|nr:hypothetical protein MLD38_003505 [Melastoma candidum]